MAQRSSENSPRAAARAGAAAWYAQTYRESVDIEGFIDTLRELGLVRGTVTSLSRRPRSPRWAGSA